MISEWAILLAVFGGEMVCSMCPSLTLFPGNYVFILIRKMAFVRIKAGSLKIGEWGMSTKGDSRPSNLKVFN